MKHNITLGEFRKFTEGLSDDIVTGTLKEVEVKGKTLPLVCANTKLWIHKLFNMIVLE